jgi:hypothetical protein
MTLTRAEAHRIWITAEKIKRVSDGLLQLGPFSVGVDGLLAFVPVAGTAFSLAAGGWLILEALRARVSGFTLARMCAYLGLRTLVSIIPLEGWLADFLFRGHMFAANALQRDITARFGEPARAAVEAARRNPFGPSTVPAS